MKCLVTGANGFLGRNLVTRLLAENGRISVRGIVRSEQGRSTLVDHLGRAGASVPDIRVGSFWDEAFVRSALEDVGLLFHLAASPRGAPADIFLNTVVGSKRLLDAIASLPGSRPRIVLVSSFGVYGTAQLPRRAILDESAPLESHPERRDHYSHAKLRQEILFRDFATEQGVQLVVLRPGSIYGPGGNALPARVGLRLPGAFLFLGGRNALPLSFVENCAEAVRVSGFADKAVAQAFNVHDDDLPTCREYFRLYRKHVEKLRSVSLPYWLTLSLARGVHWYHRRSRGQMPAFLTPYKVASIWKPCRFDNERLKGLGWKQRVPTAEGLQRTFESLNAPQLDRGKK